MTKNKEKIDEKVIGYIGNGVVIDHIPYGQVWQVAELLGVDKGRDARVSLGDGYESQKIGTKGILKIEGRKLTKKQLNLIALVAESATVNVIENGDVKERVDVRIPRILEGIVECPNHGCISNDEHERVDPHIKYRARTGFTCHYCATEFGKEDLKLRAYD